jgi:hypothetical protein
MCFQMAATTSAALPPLELPATFSPIVNDNDLIIILMSTLAGIPRDIIKLIDGYVHESCHRIYVMTSSSTIWTLSYLWSRPLIPFATTVASDNIIDGSDGDDDHGDDDRSKDLDSGRLSYRIPWGDTNNLLEGCVVTWTYNDHLYLHSRLHHDLNNNRVTMLPSPPSLLSLSLAPESTTETATTTTTTTASSSTTSIITKAKKPFLGSVTVRVADRLYIIGGKHSKQCNYYNIMTSTMHMSHAMKSPRQSLSACYWDGYIYGTVLYSSLSFSLMSQLQR